MTQIMNITTRKWRRKMPCEVVSQKISRREDPLRHGAYKLVEEKAILS